GVQVAIDGGAADFMLIAPDAPGSAHITAVAADAPAAGPAAAALAASREIAFDPELRPLVAVGAAEGTVALRDLFSRGARAPRATGFEQPIGSLRTSFGDLDAGARGALFMKGRIAESLQLTVGWDSDRPAGTRRFRDIQPDAYYPIYGDG